MVEQEYSLKELAVEAGLDPRTIRFYIAEKLLRGPESRGRHARYTDYHLKRLRVIRTLNEVYKMPLKEIRRHMMRAGDEDIDILALRPDRKGGWEEKEPPLPPSIEMSTLKRRARMARERAEKTVPEISFMLNDVHAFSAKEKVFEAEKPTPLDTLIRSLRNALPARKVPSSSRGESWRVIEITPEVKLQVKDVFSDEDMARFEEVADYVREILLGGDET